LVELADRQPIFIGFKLGTSLRRELEALSGPDRKYVSTEDSTFLRICRVRDDYYVGKLIHERLTTQRIDDICRNIFSILQRVCPDQRLPHNLEILAARSGDSDEAPQGKVW
jgi:hypothetical protein